MELISSAPSTDSPFDQIKKIDEQGNEYWLATELLALLGWGRAGEAVTRGKLNSLV
ncbi:hypothetical protein [Anabaena azotica]|uniref:DNA-damage-inducible protein D n=1 Tax=Anabaena azotica FACHB-119 TaxID=947527 RepID=A0ABR8DHA0_9NOST|nr:hypothetical protein [Anabaena azotica]MBD2505567.1 hypothetical protein [Anabaena azotica FACHB-119]